MAELSAEELQQLEKFGDELGIEPSGSPEQMLGSALAELGIAGGATARESFLLVEGEMRRSAELRAQAAVLHSGGAEGEDFEDFEDPEEDAAAPAPQPAPVPQETRQQRSFSSEDLLAAHGPTTRPTPESGGESGWGSWIGKATEVAGAFASVARGDGGGRVVLENPDDPGAVCAETDDGKLVVTYLKEGRIGVAFDPPTWPRVEKTEPNSLSTKLTQLKAGLLLLQIEGTDVARLPMSEAFAIFAKKGRPVTLTFGVPEPDVVATFDGDTTLGLNFLRNSANPLNLAKIGSDGQAAKLPQLKPDLLLTHVNGTCVAGAKPEFDGALALVRDAKRPMTLTFTPLPPDLRPKPPAKTEEDGMLNLEPMKLDLGDTGVPHIHEGWLEKNRPKGLKLIWQARYFVLDEDILSYYESIEMATQYGSFGGKTQGNIVKRGEIPLSTVLSVAAVDDITFIVTTVNAPGDSSVESNQTPREPYKLRAENAHVARQWVYNIKVTCEKLAAKATKSGLRVTWSNCEAAMDELAEQQAGTGAAGSAPNRDRVSNALANEWTPSPRSRTPGGSSDSGGFSPAGDADSIVIDDGEASGAKLRAMALNGALPVLRGLLATIARQPDGGSAILNEAGTDGQTALHIAAQHGHDKVVAMLVDAGAAVDAVNEVTGRTPLHVSCVAGHSDCVAQLLKVGAEEMMRDKRGRTALEAARRAKQQAVLDLPSWSAKTLAAANSPARRTSPRASSSPTHKTETTSSPASPTAGAAASRLARLEALSAMSGETEPVPTLIPAVYLSDEEEV